jgi:hypothetical protein
VSSGLKDLSAPVEVSEPLEFRAFLDAFEQRALVAAVEGDPEEDEEDEDEDEEGDEDEDDGDEDEDDDEEDAEGEEKA